MYTFGAKSASNLAGVHPLLVSIMAKGLQVCHTELYPDFAIIEGLRSQAKQKELVSTGKSKTMKSHHLTGHAVDIVPYGSEGVSWELEHYAQVVHGIARAARFSRNQNGPQFRIRWGGAWTTPDIIQSVHCADDALRAHDLYVDSRVKAGKDVFVDCPHFELIMQSVSEVYRP